MIRFILYLIIFYLLYKGGKFVWRIYTEHKKIKQEIKNNSKSKTDYRDIVDAEFIEINDEKEKNK